MSLPLLPAYITNHPAFTSLQHLLSPVTHRLNDLLFSDPPPTMSQLPSETFDPATPSVPISYPVKTLEDLESRAYFNSFHFRFNKASVPLSPHASSPLPDRRRLLVCHDMAGGYGDDKWVQGGTNPEAFDLTHWNLMDVFVYFSHSLVTLPPPSWTNTAHLHGVKVLGTFITEWEEGKIIANEMLSTKESAQIYAERLTELALALGFDGWLLNMEVSLDVSVIPNLKEFVSHLSTTMHSSVPGSLVIWYDSITIDGELRWQDQLNEKNKPFFDLCDGIFVNYTWKESYPGLSGAVAGHRRHDVYMGIDVFGRNTFGGGQWNSNVALDLLRKEDVSAALFAPGWVYETKQPPDYQTAKTHWWSLVEKSWGVAQSYPKSLPFYSNFDQGHGFHFSVDGKQVLDTPWNNISCQGLQPFIGFSPQNAVQVTIDFKEACYSGGSNILFNGRLEGHNDFKASLFHGDILLGDFPLQLTFSVKSEADSQLGLYLKYYSMEGESNSILLAPHKENNISARFDQVIETTQTSTQSGWVIHRSSIAVKGKKLTEIGAVCFTATSGGNYRAALGHISIKNSEEPGPSFPPSSSWLVEAKNVKWTATKGSESLVDVQIDWKMRDGNDSLFPRYNVYAENAPDLLGQETVRKFLGVASVESFYVDGFSVPSDISGVKFVIQVCGSDGSNQKIEESPFLRLDKPKE